MDLEFYNNAAIWDSSGIKVGLTHPQDRIIMRQSGFNVEAGKLTEVVISPTIIDTTDNAIMTFEDPERRDCYTDEEFDLKYSPQKSEVLKGQGFRFSMENCYYEAFLQKIVDNCNCIYNDDYQAKKANPNLESCNDVMNASQLQCSLAFSKLIGNEDDGLNTAINKNNGKLQKCLNRCKQQQENRITSTTLTYPNKNLFLFKHHNEACLVVKKLTKICNDPIRKKVFEEYYLNRITCQELLEFQDKNNVSCDGKSYFRPDIITKNDTIALEFCHHYAKENFAKVAIYLKNPYYTKIVRDVKITFTTFICNAGGLVGLCLGLSFISIFEVIYHFLKFIFNF